QVERRVTSWKESRSHKQHPCPEFQLKWEAEVVEYVQCLWKKTLNDSPNTLGFNVPLLGPRFLPPTYLHTCKCPGNGAVEPMIQYLKPFNIVHPFYIPQLARCP
ncbi:uncharacterized protein EDB91DRAFT_1036469, partial [Suillus paluster]|uniref:uncharacterized protein n=1 Tax=Suillus paluster TaxID=48578 RepID=UPI001B878F39